MTNATENLDVDAEVRHSLTEIERQRSRSLVAVIAGVVLLAAAIGATVLLAYNEEPDAAKPVPAAAPAP